MGNSASKAKEELFVAVYAGLTVDAIDILIERVKKELGEKKDKTGSSSFKLSSLRHDMTQENLLQAACSFSHVMTGGACSLYKIGFIKKLLPEFDINEQDPLQKNTPLMCVLSTSVIRGVKGKREFLDTLRTYIPRPILDHNDDENRKHKADLVELLLLEGANPLLQNANNETALHIAARERLPKAVDELCAHASGLTCIKIKDIGLMTPLLLAAQAGNKDSVESILALCSHEEKNYATETTSTSSGTLLKKNALFFAVQDAPSKIDLIEALLVNGVEFGSSYQALVEIVETLVIEGKVPKNSKLQSYFQSRPKDGYFEVMKRASFSLDILKSRQYEPDIDQYLGKTKNPLVDACILQNISLFRLFLDQGLSPLQPIDQLTNSKSCLEIIASYYLPTYDDLACQFLAAIRDRSSSQGDKSYSSDWSVYDSARKTPLDYAHQNGPHTHITSPCSKIGTKTALLLFLRMKNALVDKTKLKYHRLELSTLDVSDIMKILKDTNTNEWPLAPLLSGIAALELNDVEDKHSIVGASSIDLSLFIALESLEISNCEHFLSINNFKFPSPPRSSSVPPLENLTSITIKGCSKFEHDLELTKFLATYSSQLESIDFTSSNKLVTTSLVGNNIVNGGMTQLKTLKLRGCTKFEVSALFSASSNNLLKTLETLDIVGVRKLDEAEREGILKYLLNANVKASLKLSKIYMSQEDEMERTMLKMSLTKKRNEFVLQELPNLTWHFKK